MFLNGEYKPATWTSEHPYLYGRLIGVYHANVSFVGVLPDGTRLRAEEFLRLDFGWIHWYQPELAPTKEEFELDCVSLMSLNHASALGFVDPADILRGVHLVPRFACGKWNQSAISKSRMVGYQVPWKSHYVNR